VIVLHVHEALSLRRCVEARLSSHAHAHAGTSHQRWPHSADTKFSTRGRRVTDHTVACTSPLTHCPGYLQALEPSARPVQVFRAQLRCASCMLAQWQQHGAHLEPKLSLRLRCTSAWAVARATAQKCRCIVAVLADTALAALAALAAIAACQSTPWHVVTAAAVAMALPALFPPPSPPSPPPPLAPGSPPSPPSPPSSSPRRPLRLCRLPLLPDSSRVQYGRCLSTQV